MQRKFTRKKKVEEKPAPVITMYDYKKDLRVEELYKKRFLFWKSWHGELIDRLDETYKKRIDCYDQALMNLQEMKNYLAPAKAAELELFAEKMKALDPDIRKKRLTELETREMKSSLEKMKRRIDNEFSYSNVENFLELRK